jgi:hypothetical protein
VILRPTRTHYSVAKAGYLLIFQAILAAIWSACAAGGVGDLPPWMTTGWKLLRIRTGCRKRRCRSSLRAMCCLCVRRSNAIQVAVQRLETMNAIDIQYNVEDKTISLRQTTRWYLGWPEMPGLSLKMPPACGSAFNCSGVSFSRALVM